MSYVDLMAFLGEINRPPGGKDSVRRVIQNCFINKESKVIDVGCNTGYCSFEIVHTAKCHVTGVDLNRNMIKAADGFKKKDPFGFLVDFKIADAMKLPFKSEVFDVVFSGGSTAFIEDKEKAVGEYKRILKQWGFIADINFFYRIVPPIKLISQLNKLMDINIKPWKIDYWISLYKNCGLEKYFIYTDDVKKVTKGEINKYCLAMASQKSLSEDARRELIKRLTDIMNLFNENHKYLSYGIFIFRKGPDQEQISLFGE